MTSSIIIERRFHAELHYRVLSHLDLGRDAANLYRAERPKRSWAKSLLKAYRKAPGRLILQVLPLLVTDLKTELHVLRSHRLSSLDDKAGRILTEHFADVLESESKELSDFSSDQPVVSWLKLLDECRHYLWEEVDQSPPPLRILDCPSLAAGAWTRGRATTTRRGRVVAISLNVPTYRAFLQVLHEEVHPVTDPEVRSRFGPIQRSTRLNSPGFEFHHKLEQQAVERGVTVLEARAPELLDDYDKWRKHHEI